MEPIPSPKASKPFRYRNEPLIAKVFEQNSWLECIAYRGVNPLSNPEPVERRITSGAIYGAPGDNASRRFLDIVVRHWEAQAQA